MNLTPASLDAPRILQLADQWRMDAHLVDTDRAELSRHYNGGALEEEDDQSGNPRTRRANMLIGYKFLSRPVEQLLATYDDGVGFLEGRLSEKKIQPSRRRIVESHLNQQINLVIQESERLYWPWRANVGDAVINGIGNLYKDDPYDWAPKYGRPYFPWDAPADITDDKFSDWCFLGNLTLSAILARLERIKDLPEEDSYWNRAQLTNIAEAIAKRHLGENQLAYQPIQQDDPLKWREWIQTQSWGAEALMTACPVVWFFAKRFDKDDKRPIDMYCVPRWGEVEKVTNQYGNPSKLSVSRDGSNKFGVLFYQQTVFESVTDCFFPTMLSCMVGGEPLMRRTMGLGALMYDLDIRVQQSVNNMFDATDFDFSPLFQASDQQSEMELQELAGTKIRPYDIMPSGARFMEKPKGSRPYSSVFELTQLMNSEMGNQAQSFHGGGDFENKGRAELEVQVLERRQQLATALRLRMGDFIRRMDLVAASIGNILVNEELIECDRAWPERQKLKKRLEDLGVEWEEVFQKMEFKMRRPPGHGDPGLALYRAQQTEAIARGLGPEAHRIAQRGLIAAVNGGDTQLAEEMVPSSPPGMGLQEQQAMAQSATCLTTFMPAPVLETDNPMAHIPIHMSILQSHFAMATEAGNRWSRADQRGWEALAAHALADNNVLGAFNPQMAKAVDQAVKQMTMKAGQFEISAVPGQVDQMEQAKLQLSMAEQKRKEVKTQDDMRHRQETQVHREEQAGFQNNLQMAQLVNSERDSEVNRSAKLAKTSMDIAVQAQPPSGSP